MNDEDLKKALKGAYQAAEGKPPSFGATMDAAKTRESRYRFRLKAIAGIAAAVVATLAMWPVSEPEMTDEFLIADSLMNSTTWSAPSDALMPEHQFDIYQEIPFLDRSTISEEGSLL